MLNFFKKKTPGHLTITLNAKLQPRDRAELEDAFDKICKENGIMAEVDGGGTLMEDSGEVKECDIDIRMDNISDENVKQIVELFEAMLAPIGSRCTVSGQESIQFGKHQGLGLYLNGTDLPDEIYKNCDSNFVYSECERLLEGIAIVNSHWQGPSETALYMYGKDFSEINRKIKPLIDSYPLCQKARVVRIA